MAAQRFHANENRQTEDRDLDPAIDGHGNLLSESFRPDQRIDKVSGDTDGDETCEDVIQHRLQPRTGRDIGDREQKKAGTGSKESKVEHIAPPSKAPMSGRFRIGSSAAAARENIDSI
jgi:hypothetical protein